MPTNAERYLRMGRRNEYGTAKGVGMTLWGDILNVVSAFLESLALELYYRGELLWL